MTKYVRALTLPTLLMVIPLVCLVSLLSAQTGQVLTGAAAFTDWKADAPGVRRHIRPTDVPAPITDRDPEGSVANNAKVVASPSGATPKVPDGFAVQVFATGFKMPRTLLAEGYDTRARRQAGNFPQAFSHIGLINSALNLSRAGVVEERGRE